MSVADALLSRLDSVRHTGSGKWLARCPAHEDRQPSLSTRELDDGRILLHDFVGCSIDEVLRAVDLDMTALFPPTPMEHRCCRESRPFPAADVIRAVAFEALVVACASGRLNDCTCPARMTDEDRERLGQAVVRLNNATEAAGL